MGTLYEAIRIATETHKGKVDKGGNPYIIHPLAVMAEMKTVEEMIVAILHDAVEDSVYVSYAYLRRKGFSKEIIDAINSVTRRPGESYREYVLRAGENPIGRKVKIADLMHNMNLSRIPNPSEIDLKRSEKYKKALKLLLGEDLAEVDDDDWEDRRNGEKQVKDWKRRLNKYPDDAWMIFEMYRENGEVVPLNCEAIPLMEVSDESGYHLVEFDNPEDVEKYDFHGDKKCVVVGFDE